MINTIKNNCFQMLSKINSIKLGKKILLNWIGI